MPVAPGPRPQVDPSRMVDVATDKVPGISAERAYRELLAGKKPARTVVVAIIDSGIDISHPELRDAVWTNPKEIAGNGKDDDGNGYVDDIHGWDFIGGKDGRDVDHDTYEVTRLFAACGATPGTGHNTPAGTVRPAARSRLSSGGITASFCTIRPVVRGRSSRILASTPAAAS